MARSRTRPASSPPPPPAGGETETGGDLTGKYLVLLRDDGVKEGLQAIKDATGLKEVCNAADYGAAAVEMTEANDAEVFMLDKLRVAVVDADPTQLGGLRSAAADDGAILAVEPERIMFALIPPPDVSAGLLPFEYLRGYKDAVDNLYAALTGERANGDVAAELAAARFADTAQFTWGLQATRVSQSRFSGRGVRVAVLDTGFDLDHPDFAGRVVTSQSFVTGQAVKDLNGHGTHCIGTALGSQQTAGGARRYGCAFRGDVFAGKVLSNQGSGADSGILAGINWAVTNQCRVVSMSLGAPTQVGEPFSPVYEAVAQRALRSNPGTLIVAAAGNESSRPGVIKPVGRPANCPSILAVAALDANLGIAPFSCGGINPSGGGVDVAGPGVGVFSSWPDPALVPGGPARYRSISGTSMATPHTAGIAAMWLEARPGSTAQALWQLLTGNARRLALPSRDVGAGLVQAPV
ncbi:S8 family serine peptidase [bacterium]|nr:S8 family serine peptidase [bacterium]